MNTEEQRYVRNADFIFRKVVEEMVLIPIHKNVADMDSIYTLNDLGAFLWEKLEKPCTAQELENAVLDEYDVDNKTVQADIEQFLQDMVAIHAVEKVTR
jgi:hypothetical protein